MLESSRTGTSLDQSESRRNSFKVVEDAPRLIRTKKGGTKSSVARDRKFSRNEKKINTGKTNDIMKAGVGKHGTMFSSERIYQISVGSDVAGANGRGKIAKRNGTARNRKVRHFCIAIFLKHQTLKLSETRTDEI